MESAQEILTRIGTDNPPTAEELAAARKELAAAMKAARNEVRPDLEALTSLRAAYDEVTEALEAAEAAEAALASEADELLDGIDVEDDEVVVEDEVVEVVEVAASGKPRVLPLDEALARFANRAPARTTPVVEAEIKSGTTYSVLTGPSMKEHGATINLDEMADLFNRFGRAQRPGNRTQIVSIRTDLGEDRTLTASTSPDKVMEMLDSITAPEAVAAAGGCCVLAENLPESTTPFDASRPLRDSLPSMTVNGAVRWFPPICLPQDGAAVWTCAEDAAVLPNDENTWKQCAEVECPEAEEVSLDAIYQCITIGNFQQRFNPQRWAEILRALTASKARLSEIHLWSQMLAGASTVHPGIAYGSLYLNVVNSVLRAAEEIRLQNRLVDSVNMRVWLPSWVPVAIAADLSARRLVETTAIEARTLLASALGSYGVNVTYSKDLHPFTSPQVSGAFSAYATTISTIVAPEGYYTFLDGGELNLGTEIRDHDLNRQNKVAAFAETFEGLMARGCDAKQVDIAVEICENAVACPA